MKKVELIEGFDESPSSAEIDSFIFGFSYGRKWKFVKRNSKKMNPFLIKEVFKNLL